MKSSGMFAWVELRVRWKVSALWELACVAGRDERKPRAEGIKGITLIG